MEQVPQFGQTPVPGLYHTVDGFEHQAVSGFVKVELHAQAFRILQLRQGMCVRQGDDHQVAVGITHGGREVHIGQHAARSMALPFARRILCEEAYCLSRLEFMLRIRMFRAFRFHDKLVERVVVASAYAERIPA